MALPTSTLPYGLRSVKLTPYSNAGATTLGTPSVALPNARTFSFSEAEDYEELRGDDKVIAKRGKGASIAWSVEAGGISLEALKVLNGGTITETGTTPAQVKKYRKLVTDARPYFQAEGQAISDSGGDFHTVVFRCRATGSVDGEMGDGSFWLTSASGDGLPSLATGSIDALYDFIQNETAVAPV
jgi:hypothetical protein